MNEKTNLVKEEHTLPEAPWIDISIKPEKMELFEAFCERNRIPYETINSTVFIYNPSICIYIQFIILIFKVTVKVNKLI